MLLRQDLPRAKQKKNNVDASPAATPVQQTNHTQTTSSQTNISAEEAAGNTISNEPIAPKTAVSPTPILKKKMLNLADFEEAILNEKGSQADEEVVNVPLKAIDEDAFKTVWEEYIRMLSEEGNAGLATSFAAIVCKIDFNKIILEISSSSIEELIKKDKAKLIEFFRNKLANQSIDLETCIMENAQQVNMKSLSPKEKLTDMVSRNPDVLKLIQDLGLELDF